MQNHRFLKQLQRILTRKAVELFLKISTDDPEKFKEISKIYGNALRIGMLESEKDKLKIAKLLRFQSTTSDYTSLEEVSHSLLRDSLLICSTSTTEKRARSRCVYYRN